MAISDDDYNKARAILVLAGSRTAGASHDKHTQGKGSPDDHGKALLRAARDEFRQTDQGQPNLKSQMTQAHYKAIADAASKMSLSSW